MGICSRTHKAAQELIRNGLLPRLDELGNNLVMEDLVNSVQESRSRRRQIVEASTFVSTDLIDQHLLQPVKLHTMIHDYMTRLEKDMSSLDDSIAMIEAMLEQLSYRRIESLYNQLEILDSLSPEKKFIGKRQTIVFLSSFS
jgi:hypothetical protein